MLYYIMSILLVNPNLPDLQIIRDCVKGIVFEMSADKYSNIDEILSSITSNTKRIGFMFDHVFSCVVPFFPDTYEKLKLKQKSRSKSKSTYKSYSNNLVDFMTKCVKINQSIVFDIISCNFNDSLFISETQDLKSKLSCEIEYSLDKTGNSLENGNYIMESNGIDITDQYFTTNIINWKHVLDLPTEIYGAGLPSFSIQDFLQTYFINDVNRDNQITVDYNESSLIYKLTMNSGSISLKPFSSIISTPLLFSDDNGVGTHQRAIMYLDDGQTFNGNNVTIKLNGGEGAGCVYYGLFLGSNNSDSTPTMNISYLSVSNMVDTNNNLMTCGYDSNGNGCGGLVAFNQLVNITINNCVLLMNINVDMGSSGCGCGGGGFVGSGCGNVTINNCNISGYVSANSMVNVGGGGGGFVGAGCGNVAINNSYISGSGAYVGANGESGGGGFVGVDCGNITINNSYIRGQNVTVNGFVGGGGFVGVDCGNIDINNSYINTVEGVYAGNDHTYIGGGGFVGVYCGNTIINNSYIDTANIKANGNSFGGGGFVGLTYDSICTINNSYIYTTELINVDNNGQPGGGGGGFVGSGQQDNTYDKITINNSTITGAISNNNGGGLVGANRCYNKGSITLDNCLVLTSTPGVKLYGANCCHYDGSSIYIINSKVIYRPII